jgi:hypothetical protein
MENLTFCLEQTKISTCICSTVNAKNLLKLENIGNLKNIILCDEVDKELE